MNWDEYFLGLAVVVAQKSKDDSRKVGCVIVGPQNEIRSTGYNGFPRGIDEKDPDRWARPTKYDYLVHSELNAVLNAARVGVSLKNCIAYITAPPCSECAKALIQVGIVQVVVPTQHEFTGDQRWQFSMKLGQEMLTEASINLKWVQ